MTAFKLSSAAVERQRRTVASRGLQIILQKKFIKVLCPKIQEVYFYGASSVWRERQNPSGKQPSIDATRINAIDELIRRRERVRSDADSPLEQSAINAVCYGSVTTRSWRKIGLIERRKKKGASS